MSGALPPCETLTLAAHPQWLEIRLNRPRARNAMSFQMVEELSAVFSALGADTQAVLIRGAGGHFCAGGDVRDMAAVLQQRKPSEGAEEESDPLVSANRRFGTLLSQLQRAPQFLLVALEGAVMGGGFGLACVSDLALALPSAEFGMPEVTLGITPAQIAPFVVARIGLTAARRLALMGQRIGAEEALRLGLIHELCADEATLQEAIQRSLVAVSRCAPGARAATKALLLEVGAPALEESLDRAAAGFAEAARGPEGQAGMMAFISKQRAPWRAPWGEITAPGVPGGGEEDG